MNGKKPALEFLESEFSLEELEHKTRELYSYFTYSPYSCYSIFNKIFYVNYKFLFGQDRIEETMLLMLKNYYRNEFFIKNRFCSSILKDSKFIMEYPVGECRADILSLSKKLPVCYEIKTKYDTLARINRQLATYTKVFPYTYAICSEDKLSAIISQIPKYCGIYSYKDRSNCSFTKIRSATLSPSLENSTILSCFRKSEKTALLSKAKERNISDFDAVNLSCKLAKNLLVRYAK